MDAQTRDNDRGMSREEKEAAAAFAVATAVLAPLCVLSPQTCAIGVVIAATAALWAYAWIFFFRLLREAAERQRSHD